MPTALSNQAAILCPCHADRQSVAMCIKTHDKWKRVWQEKQPAFMIGAVEPGGKQSLCTVKQHVKVMPPFFALVVQTDGLLPSASDFMTSGDKSGGGKSGTQRKRSLKDKPRKSRRRRMQMWTLRRRVCCMCLTGTNSPRKSNFKHKFIPQN